MPIITFNGPIGCGGNELGLKVADMLDADYVDRIVFAEAAKRVGSTISALAEKEETGDTAARPDCLLLPEHAGEVGGFGGGG